MIFKQVFDQKSSTYTYIIASAEGREALIIDPVLENVEDYIKLLTELNLKLEISLGLSKRNRPLTSNSFLSKTLGVVSLLIKRNITTLMKMNISNRFKLILLIFIK